MLIRRGDTVQIVTGDDRGTVGKVLRVLTEEGRIVVEGVNKVYKHVRPSQRNPRGGRLSKEMPINASNVLFYNAELGRGVRLGVRFNEAGDKVRYCKKSGREVGIIRRKREQATTSE